MFLPFPSVYLKYSAMIYLLLGSDEFAIEQAVKRLLTQFEIPEMGMTRLRTANRDQVLLALNNACTLTLDGTLQLLWIQQCKQLIEKGDVLDRYLEALSGEEAPTLLVLSAEALDGRLKAVKQLKEIATVETYEQISIWQGDELRARVHQCCTQADLKLGRQELSALVEQVSNDSRALQQAIEVLSLYGATGQAVTVEVISALVTRNNANGLEFIKALLKRDCNGALEALEQWLSLGESPLPLLATATGQIRIWVGVKAIITQKPYATNEEIAKALRLSGNPSRVYYLKQEVASMRLESLVALMRMVVTTEYAIKTGADSKLVMRRLALAAGGAV